MAILLTLSSSVFFSTFCQFLIAMLRNSSPSNVSSLTDMLHDCFSSTVGSTIMTSYIIIISFTLLPLYTFIIYLVLRQWLQQHSAKSISHSDLFTFNMTVIELISILGSIIICVSNYCSILQMLSVGIYIFSFNLNGQLWFHLLTCLERYVAVVHPFTYRSLRKEKAVRVRNIIIVWVWLACIAFLGIESLEEKTLKETIMYCLILPLFFTMSLCNLIILLVLHRPRPGDSCRQQPDQSRMRALYTILFIMATLLLRFGWDLISFKIIIVFQLQEEQTCAMLLSTIWTNIPSSLVLPLLFLHRAGKLKCLRNQTG